MSFLTPELDGSTSEDSYKTDHNQKFNNTQINDLVGSEHDARKIWRGNVLLHHFLF